MAGSVSFQITLEPPASDTFSSCLLPYAIGAWRIGIELLPADSSNNGHPAFSPVPALGIVFLPFTQIHPCCYIVGIFHLRDKLQTIPIQIIEMNLRMCHSIMCHHKRLMRAEAKRLPWPISSFPQPLRGTFQILQAYLKCDMPDRWMIIKLCLVRFPETKPAVALFYPKECQSILMDMGEFESQSLIECNGFLQSLTGRCASYNPSIK